MPKSQSPRRIQKLTQVIGDKVITHRAISWEQRLINEKYGKSKAQRLGR